MSDTISIAPLLTVEEVAKRLSITRKTLYTLRKEGKLSAVLLKGCVRFTEKEIQRFIEDSLEPKN